MIVAVTGGKGGVGKSTVAYNLGAALDAVVVDGDLGMADLPGAHGPDLHDVLAGRASAVEAVREGGPVALLPCGRTLAGARGGSPTRLVATLEAVECAYADVVVDCPAGLGSDVGLSLLAADACVVVTTPEAVALTDALRARELARELDAGLVSVVVNRCEKEPAGVARRFGAPAVAVPTSADLARAQSNGLPLRAVAPGAVAVERFRTLARAVQSAFNS